MELFADRKVLLSAIAFLVVIGLAAAAFLMSSRSPLSLQSGAPEAGSPQKNSPDLARDAGVPDLPFPDNPDPDQCGIPVQWGDDNQAWLTGYYEGELIQPVVSLYDSHLRLEVKAQAPHGAEVDVLLYQENPVLDYYLVKIEGRTGEGSEGWIPAPLLSFEPVQPLEG